MDNLSDIRVVQSLLSRHGFTFSKALGQNFLINPTVCPRMAELSGAGKGVGVIEIGPGIGVLTAELAKRAEKVAAIELDERLLPVLSETLHPFDNVEIVSGDVLKLDLHKLIRETFSGLPVYVCANLPYYITSPVIMRLLESRLPLKAITVMVQKEAAQRLCAPVGSRESGAITVAANYYAILQVLFQVSRGSFLPPPNVDSTVLRLDVRQEPPVAVTQEAFFFRLIRSAFEQRRKTLLNAASAGMGIPKETMAAALAAADLPSQVRGEKLRLEDFANLSNWLCASADWKK